MTEHDTALLGSRQGPEGCVGGRSPAPGGRLAGESPQPPAASRSRPPAAPPAPGLPPPAGATLGPLDLCPSDLEEVLGDQDCPLELQTGKVSPRGLE